MDRSIIYPGALPLDTDILSIQRNAMIAEGFLAQAMLGNGPVVNRLACSPTSPASSAVNIGPGMIAALETVDATALDAAPRHHGFPLVKVRHQNLSTVASTALGTITAPGTSGQSQVYLISAAFSETDTGSLVLSYYNAANPTVAYAGPNNTGAAQNTQRIQRAALTLTAGTPAATGSQVAPATPAGGTALWTITVAYGQSTITSGNIAAVVGAPFIGGGSVLPGRLLNIQKWTANGTYTYTPTVGTNTTIWEVRGAGASGGGVAATAAMQMAAGSGGGSGGFVRHRATSGFAGAAIVVGKGGAAPPAGANDGNDGTASSVTASGFTLTAPGGYHGLGTTAQTASFMAQSGQPGSIGTGGNELNAPGDQGGPGIGMIVGGSYFLLSGDGGEGTDGGGGASVGGRRRRLAWRGPHRDPAVRVRQAVAAARAARPNPAARVRMAACGRGSSRQCRHSTSSGQPARRSRPPMKS